MIRLHHSPQSRSMRTLWLLHELAVPFEVVEHAFGKNLRDPAYLALNPAGRVPALEIDGEVLFETCAIAEYLCERFNPTGLGRMPGHPERAAWLVWLHFSETISQHLAALTQQHVALRDPETRSGLVMKLETARLGKCLDALEGRLAHRQYLVGDSFTAADLGCAQAVYIAAHFHRLGAHSALSDWYDRCTARPAFARSLPTAQRIYGQDFYEVPA